MNDAPRRTLRELIARYGNGLCTDARRCEGLLRDLCGEHRREINILVGALRERVPLDLMAGRNSVPTGLLLTRLSKRLEDNLALTEGASRWAVDSWALALGVVSDAELGQIRSRHDDERKSRHDEAPPPRVEARPTLKPPASKPSSPRSPASPAARPTAPVSPNAATRPHPAPPTARPPSAPQVSNAGGLQEPSTSITPRSGRGFRRGCLVGCFLFLLLSVLLAAGAPFVINILREEQEQRNLEPPPVQTR